MKIKKKETWFKKKKKGLGPYPHAIECLAKKIDVK